jgi:hypothetical protein
MAVAMRRHWLGGKSSASLTAKRKLRSQTSDDEDIFEMDDYH